MIDNEELREALEKIDGFGCDNEVEIIIQAAQAYLKQAPCIEAIKAARREATEGRWMLEAHPTCDPIPLRIAVRQEDGGFVPAVSFKDSSTFRGWEFAKIAANEATRLIDMDKP